MVHYKNWIIQATVIFTLIALVASVQAETPAKPGNPGLPGCLAKVEQLEQTIAEQEAMIGALQEQVNTLQASLDDMNSYVRLPKTGQTTAYPLFDTIPMRDDGELQKGVEWPVPRFTDNGDGTVTDHLTRLVWLKNANCFGIQSWYEASIDCNNLADGQCGLSDGSSIGDWRLPNRNELLSLVDIETDGVKIAGFASFTNVSEDYYWSSSTAQYNFNSNVYSLYLYDGTVHYSGKAQQVNHVWPVRDPK